MMFGMDPYDGEKQALEDYLAEAEHSAHDYSKLANKNSPEAQWTRRNAITQYDKAKETKETLELAYKSAMQREDHFNLSMKELEERRNFLDRVAQRLKMVDAQLVQPENDEMAGPARGGMTREERRRKAAEAHNQRIIDSGIADINRQYRGEKYDNDLDDQNMLANQLKMAIANVNQDMKDEAPALSELGEKMDKVKTMIDDLVGDITDFMATKNRGLWIGSVILTIIMLAMIIYAFCI